MASRPDMRVGILGAGSIGCYLGAHLLQAGIDTILLGRERLAQEVRAHGLRVTDFTGKDFHLPPAQVACTTEVSRLADRNLILVTLKSAATEAAARQLQPFLAPETTVVSFQNGVRNAETLRRVLPQMKVLAGMVPYNVVWNPGAHFHSGTSGKLVVEATPPRSAEVCALLCAAGLAAVEHGNLPGILWGKLIFNLNNPINALAGIPLREELSQAGYRAIIAAAMREALRILKQTGIQPVRSGSLIPGLAPFILSLPDFLFFRIAAGMIKIDPQARSSMWEDLHRGRPTEIDFINGEIVRLAESHRLSAPVNSRIVTLVREAEQQSGSPGFSAVELARRLGL
ncbi:MAG: 2-dehydropantoate 2-reductase [Blastocatellia bacterium]|nr:2-dehydropantoate 2-reductase [Blastocatellia bacterium]